MRVRTRKRDGGTDVVAPINVVVHDAILAAVYQMQQHGVKQPHLSDKYRAVIAALYDLVKDCQRIDK